MKHIKRLLAGLLIAAMALAVLASCASEEPMESAGEVSDFSSEKHFDINDILQNGDESEEGESTSVGSPTGEESSVESSVSTDESSAGTTSEPVSQEQSGDETPPEESTASTTEESQGVSSNPSAESTNTPSQGTTSQPSENSQGTTSTPPQGTTSQPSQGSTSQPSQGTTSQPSGGELTGEIVASEKKYTYKSENLMLLHVENKTALHLDITIKGKYLDKSGKVIKEETQTYRAFPSGWSNYFIFRPKGTFNSFDYTIEAKVYKQTTTSDKLYSYNGDPLSKYVELTYEKNLYWAVGANWDGSLRDLMFNIQLTNHHPSISITVPFHVLVLDEQGEIYAMDYEYFDGWTGGAEELVSGTHADPIGGYFDGKAQVALRTQAKGENETIPANVQGKFTVIFAITYVWDYNEMRNQLW